MITKHCDGISRRDFVRVGGLTAMGLGLGNFSQLKIAASTNKEAEIHARAKACILVWLDGGPSHIETFDPKPDAPIEVRGPLSSIKTNVPGIHVNECLERTAKVMNKLAIIRSMTSSLGEHAFGTHYLLTGYKPSSALEYPTIGATMAHVRKQSGVLPPHVSAPGVVSAVSGNGYLPTSTAPFTVGKDFRIRNLDFYRGIDLDRIDRRLQIVGALDQFSRIQDASASAELDPDLERAYNLIASKDAKRAFDLSEEPVALRERYGNDGGKGIGQGCLLARRLVERGVPFVTVNSTGWDTHRNIAELKSRYPTDTKGHLPSLDRALSALITDLSDRGLLDETLVVVMGEFGRTPKINPTGGRDHWPNVFSVVMAGAGIEGGQIIGSSDSLGELPANNPITPSDLSATIFTLLGINPAMELHTSDGRPVRVAPDGARVIEELV